MKLSAWSGPWPALTKCINNSCSCGVEELVDASHEMLWASHANMMLFEPRMCMEVIDWFEPETKPPGMDDMIDALKYCYPDIKDMMPPDYIPKMYSPAPDGDMYIATATTSANAGELVEIKIGEDFDMLEMQKTLHECRCETLLSGHWAGCPVKKG